MISLSPYLVFLTIGVALLALELVVFQFTTFWLFFVGLGALVAAAFAWATDATTFGVTTAVFVIASALITAALYRPLRKWQQKPSQLADNNAIGQRVLVVDPISSGVAGRVMWSGSEWQADLAEGNVEPLNAGDTAVVVKIASIRLLVKALD